jgi:hypothetical protein
VNMIEKCRDYIRHPLNIPIRLISSSIGKMRSRKSKGRNVSQGGICCIADRQFRQGDTLTLEIDAVKPAFETNAQVIWCHKLDDGSYEVGCNFLSCEDAFAARMVEQICHIEEYRKKVLEESGRNLSQEEAAAEWIACYAENFPGSQAYRPGN